MEKSRTSYIWVKHDSKMHGRYKLIEPRHEKTCFLPYANNKGADHPAHPRRLISAFGFHRFHSIIPILAISKISRLWLVSVAEQAGLSLTWSQIPKTGFLVTWLNCKDMCHFIGFVVH